MLSTMVGSSARCLASMELSMRWEVGADGREVSVKGRMEPHCRWVAYSARCLSMRRSMGGHPERLWRRRVGEGFQQPVMQRRPLRSTRRMGRCLALMNLAIYMLIILRPGYAGLFG